MNDSRYKPTRPDLPVWRTAQGTAAAGSRGLAPYEERLQDLCAREPNGCRGLSVLPVVKRACLYDFAEFLRYLRGLDEVLAEFVEAGRLEGSTWYPISWYRHVHEALQLSTGKGHDIAWDLGRKSVQQDLTDGPFRIFLKVVSPAFLIERGPALFRSYFRKGRLGVRPVEGEENVLELSFTQCLGFSPSIFQDVFGGIEGALLAAGAREVAVRVLEGAQERDESARVRVEYC